MEARAATRGIGVSRKAFDDGIRWAIVVLWGLFALVPLVLLARRIGGGFSEPLPGTAFFGCVAAWSALAFGLRRATTLNIVRAHAGERTQHVVRWLPGVFLLALIGSIWLPGTPVWSVVAAFIAIAGEEGLALFRKPHHWRFGRTAGTRRGGLLDEGSHESGSPNHAELDLDESVLQRLTHGRSEEGRAFWHGVIRTEFRPEQRVAAAHLAFCPPFAVSPEISAWHLTGPAADVRVTQALASGARLEIKLQTAAEAHCSAVIEFTAQERNETSRTPTTSEA